MVNNTASIQQSEGMTMFDRKFFQSKLGTAAMLSIAAMLGMNVVALNTQLGAVHGTYAAVSAQVELA